tara:strand:+ start:6693 stop:6992 length:300 start_codon:yes stop_codon:yes gene_type:complete
MSEMQMFYGTFKEYESEIPEDEDDLYDLEKSLGIYLVRVDDKVYEVKPLKELDAYGFSVVLEPSELPQVLCYWHNGGAGLHEVVEEAIKEHINAEIYTA